MVKQSTYRTTTVGIIVIGVLLLAAVVIANKGFKPDGSSMARTTVANFGAQMQKVSLLAPDASSTIATTYGGLVTPELLKTWEAHPKNAPGRLTSSPYPDHIEISSTAKQGSGYVVDGLLFLMTSTGVADRIPVVIQVIPVDGQWLIAAYQEQSSTTPAIAK